MSRFCAQSWRIGGAERSRKAPIPREQTYALLELLHALRDNVSVDLRESAPSASKICRSTISWATIRPRFAVQTTTSWFPFSAAMASRILSKRCGRGRPAWRWWRYDPNSPEIQYLQGWLMQDRFMMRDPLGCLYEFLWANPYQPGLSYELLPLVFHDASSGHVFARTSWEEDATWIGYFDGHLQVFRDGKLETLRSGASTKPVRVGDAVLLSAPAPEKDGTVRFQGCNRGNNRFRIAAAQQLRRRG